MNRNPEAAYRLRIKRTLIRLGVQFSHDWPTERLENVLRQALRQALVVCVATQGAAT